MLTHLHALDPSSATDAAAIRALFHQRRSRYPDELCDLARRVREQAAEPMLRVDAVNLLASAAVVSGDDDDGSRGFRAALDVAWGTGTHAERVACVNLAMILTRQRRLVEAFALSRRACRIALDGGDALAICLSHVQLAKTLLELGDPAGFRRAFEVAQAHRPDLDETTAGWVPALLAGMSAEVAFQDGDLERAEALMDVALAAPDVTREVLRMMRAYSLRRLGRPAEALDTVRRSLAEDDLDASTRLRFLAEELLCLVDLGDRDQLLERASGCLALMARDGRRAGSATWRLRVGQSVAAALAEDESTRAHARRALEIAAVAALERSWESKLFFQQFPQLERMAAEDVQVVEAHARRFAETHLELLAAIRTLLHGGAQLGDRITDGDGDAHGDGDGGAHGDGDGVSVSVCAWCRRLRGPEHAWIPLDAYVASTADLDISHGMCPSCSDAMLAEAVG